MDENKKSSTYPFFTFAFVLFGLGAWSYQVSEIPGVGVPVAVFAWLYFIVMTIGVTGMCIWYTLIANNDQLTKEQALVFRKAVMVRRPFWFVVKTSLLSYGILLLMGLAGHPGLAFLVFFYMMFGRVMRIMMRGAHERRTSFADDTFDYPRS